MSPERFNSPPEVGPQELDLLRAVGVDRSLVLLDGFHAVKHAARFGATILLVATSSPEKLAALADVLAPDVLGRVWSRIRLVRTEHVRLFCRERAHWTGVWGVAEKPTDPSDTLLREPGAAPVILLEDPKNLGNVGATIRVAAAASADGVVVAGGADPWCPAAVRGAAGLQYALPILRVDSVGGVSRPIIAFHPDGRELGAEPIPRDAVMAFGTEREGLTGALLSRADILCRIPMRDGVSSLNLSVAVGVALYTWKLRAEA